MHLHVSPTDVVWRVSLGFSNTVFKMEPSFGIKWELDSNAIWGKS